MRILDLYCGAGGAASGYHRAGFEIVGVDIHPQPNYPFEFYQADALTVLKSELPFIERGFDAIHASPPCQAHTTMSNRWRGSGGLADRRMDYIWQTREILEASSLPYVLENVPGARDELVHPVRLSGGMFGLRVERCRLFETNFPFRRPSYRKVQDPIGVYGKPDGRRLFTRKDGSEQRAARSVEEARAAMGIEHPMSWKEVAEAIPPAYTEYIGKQLMYEILEFGLEATGD